MNRLCFLSSLGLGAAGLVAGAEFDWDRLLWTPKPIITVPALPTRGLLRAYLGGVKHVFRNVPLLGPAKIRLPVNDLETLVIGRVEVDVTVMGRTVTVPVPHYEEGKMLDAGNSVTYEWQDRIVSIA